LVQAVPQPGPEAVSEYYAEDYRRGLICTGGADVAKLADFPFDNLYYLNRGQSIAELLRPHVKKTAPRILDVGAGYGHLLYGLGEVFPEAERQAVELSEICIPFLRSLGIHVHTELVEDALQTNTEPFDVITVSHVLEHLLEPMTVLKLLHEHLAPGGVLYIEVPNIPREYLTRYLDHVWAPRFDEPHITFFSEPTLRSTLETAGFDPKVCTTAGPEYKEISKLHFHMPHWRWFIQRAIPKPIFEMLRKSPISKGMKVQTREEIFYQYGGQRIWLRSVSVKA